MAKFKAVLLLEGSSRLTGIFHELMAEEFKQHDIELFSLDVNDQVRLQNNFMEAKNNSTYLFYMTINGFGLDIHATVNGKNVLVYEFIKTPVFNLQADPVFTNEMLQNAKIPFNPYLIDIVTDIFNIQWLAQLRGSVENIYHTPSSGIHVDLGNSDCIAIENRKIDNLLCMSVSPPEFFRDRYVATLTKKQTNLVKIFDGIVDTFESHLRSDPIVWVNTVFPTLRVRFNLSDDTHQRLISEVWHFIRMRRRIKLLNSLQDYPLNVVTNNDPCMQQIKIHKDTKLHKPINFDEFIGMLRNTKTHILPPTQYGGFHERQIAGMYQSCVTISPPNRVFEEKLRHGKDLLIYNDIEAGLPSLMAQINSNIDLQKELSANAKEQSLKYFHTRNTTDRIINIFNVISTKLK
ncbi:hypothetical protein [Glaciecola petra]|uniref:Uncharacterized protein n=1 Tax=Glaciecola petra TaxID=3075602 RepID=A0ABU2ZKZ2_9ALTE|nr:hypothetical protein [Aestuariibacter sp. P117]MDT0593278.1 hypothetical protein [Aestuariibacter sp. P117]